MLKILLLCLGICTFTPISSSAADEETAKRQCRSVHLHHGDFPKDSSAIYAEMTAIKSAPGTYFCASNFNDGYIGFQELGNGHKWVIFSIWDPVAKGDNPHDIPENERAKLIQTGENVKAKRFGGEGTGGQSFKDYDWSIDETMKFLVVKKPDGDQFKQIAGYFFNNKSKQWELISCWRTERKPDELSYSVSFVEDFARNYTSAKQQRRAAAGPVYALDKEGNWVETRKATFTGDPTPSEAVTSQYLSKYKTYSLETGGESKMGDFKLFTTQEIPADAKRTPPTDAVKKLAKLPLMKEKVTEPAKK